MSITDILAQVAARRQDLIGLAQDLIRIPTLNPPGKNCRVICGCLAARLMAQGFSVEVLRATGAPGDTDTFPRWNLVARLQRGPGECVHFNSHHNVVEVGHGSMPFLGDSAIRHMGAVLQVVKERLYPLLATKRTQMPVVPEGARSSTLNINSVHGGEAEPTPGSVALPAPCVADRCRIVIDRRFLIEEDLVQVKAEVRDVLERVRAARPGFSHEIRTLFEVQPTLASGDAPVVKSTAAAIKAVLARVPDYGVLPATYKQKHIDRIGRLSNCIANGPGLLHLAHQPDEWVGVQDMEDSAKVMALVLADLLD